MDIESRIKVQGLGIKENGKLFNGHRASVLQDEELWRWTVVMVAQQ